MASEQTYEELTEGVRVRATPSFDVTESVPDEGRFMWSYAIEIANLSARPVQLINRYWRIVDAHGHAQEVRGEGVVGKQPLLQPGEAFSYVSRCPLNAPSGMMGGHYGLIYADTSEPLIVTVPTFALDSPFANKRAN